MDKMRKLNKDDLARIRTFLIDEVFRKEEVMFSDFVYSDYSPDITDMLASLYNMLHYEVTGEEYYYFFHHANKIGAWTDDNFFDKMIGRRENPEE